MRLGTYYRFLALKYLGLLKKGDNVLDVGCHDGFLLSYVKANKRIGIDKKVIEKYPDILYIQNDFLEYDFEDKKFDKIFVLDVLEHIESDGEFIVKILDLVSDQGCVIISVPSKNIKIFPPFIQNWVNKRWEHFYRSGYSIEEFKQLLSDSQNINTELEIIYWGSPVFRFLYLILSVFWRLSEFLTKALLFFVLSVDSFFKDNPNGWLIFVIKRK